MRRHFDSPEEWGNEAFGEMVTNGRIGFFRNLFDLLFKVCATNVLVFLHRRFGVQALSFSSISWSAALLFILFSASTLAHVDTQMMNGEARLEPGSRLFYGIHLVLMIFVSIYHAIEARSNLRSSNGKARYGFDLGVSLLWEPFCRLFAGTKLVDDGSGKSPWYALRHYTFQKWVEPLIVIVTGAGFYLLGFTGYGFFLMYCGGSVFVLMKRLEDNYFKYKQQAWDASEKATMLENTQPNRQPDAALPLTGAVETAKPVSDEAFEEWKARKQKRQRPEQQNAN